MRKIFLNSVLASEIAAFLKRKLHGADLAVYGPCAAGQPTDNCMIYVEDVRALPVSALKKTADVLVLCPRPVPRGAPCSSIATPTPKIHFIDAVNKFFTRPIAAQIHPRAVIEEGAKLGRNVSVLAGSYVGPDVEIGDDTTIFQNCVVTGRVRIGARCVIKANSTIGSEIFDFVYEDGAWQQVPQVGRIIIGDDAWFGANSTIEKGALTDTVIGPGVKVDDLVQIGSGSIVGKDSIIASGSVLCREVTVGTRCWIAPHVSILERRRIHDGSVVGLGAVVIADVPKGATVAGNPARTIRRRKG
ncbi:MAG: hypothetical protein HY927_13670 [Elusimicrobia bacterium]|nr:hypothetical protein [Elusimicrobiota bacterium]